MREVGPILRFLEIGEKIHSASLLTRLMWPTPHGPSETILSPPTLILSHVKRTSRILISIPVANLMPRPSSLTSAVRRTAPLNLSSCNPICQNLSGGRSSSQHLELVNLGFGGVVCEHAGGFCTTPCCQAALIPGTCNCIDGWFGKHGPLHLHTKKCRYSCSLRSENVAFKILSTQGHSTCV